MGTIADKLLYLDGTKTALRDAINQAGGYLTTADPFRDYVGDWLRSQSATLSLEFWCERFLTRRRGGMAENALGFANIITFTRASSGGVFNEYGQYVSLATNVWRPDHDPASVTTSTSTVAFDSLTATFTLPSGHAFQVGDKFRATAVAGSLWGVVVARTDTTATVHVRNSTTTGSASSWTCIKPRGILIEEQRTRLNTVSTGATLLTPTRTTYVDDGTLFIDGVTPFRKLVEDTSTNTHFGQPALVSVLANTTYTAQYVVKAAGRTKFRLDAVSSLSWAPANPVVVYDLVAKTATGSAGATGSVKELGSGNYLITWTATTGAAGFTTSIYPILLNNAGNASYTGDGVSGIYISGYQIESGAFATSLIVGEASQVTRAADVASVNTLSPWYNASEGTLVVEFATRNQLVTFADAAVLDDGTANNRVRLGINSASPNKLVTGSYSSGVSVAVDTGIPYTPGLQKLAASYAKDNFASAANGALYAVVSAGNVPAGLNTLRAGKHTTLGYINGHIQSLEYYPRRLSNTELQEITA